MPPERTDPAGAARAGAYAALRPAALHPEDIAALALFLASDEARHINGAIIPADAGWTAAESLPLAPAAGHPLSGPRARRRRR